MSEGVLGGGGGGAGGEPAGRSSAGAGADLTTPDRLPGRVRGWRRDLGGYEGGGERTDRAGWSVSVGWRWAPGLSEVVAGQVFCPGGQEPVVMVERESLCRCRLGAGGGGRSVDGW